MELRPATASLPTRESLLSRPHVQGSVGLGAAAMTAPSPWEFFSLWMSPELLLIVLICPFTLAEEEESVRSMTAHVTRNN